MEENNSHIIYSNNSNFTHVFDYKFFRSLENATAVVQIIECVMMNVTNVALIYILVTSSPLKRPLRNGMMGAITVANLVTGLFAVPLTVDALVNSYHRHACLFFWVVWIFVLYVENFVQLWTLVLLLLHHLAQLLGWKVPPAWWNSGRLSQYSLRAAACLYVLLPWLVALLVVAPVVSNVHDFMKFELYCDMRYTQPHHQLTLLVMTCFLPGTLIIVLGAVLRLTFAKKRRLASSLTSQLNQAAEAVNTSRLRLTPDDDDVLDPDLDPTYVHVLVGLMTVLLLLPGHVLLLIGLDGIDDILLHLLLLYGFYLANDLAPTVQALLWLLLLPDLRARLQQVWAALKGRLLCKRELSPLSASGAAVPTVRFATLTRDD